MIFCKKKKILVWCDDPPEDPVISIFAGCLANHDRAHSPPTLIYPGPHHHDTNCLSVINTPINQTQIFALTLGPMSLSLCQLLGHFLHLEFLCFFQKLFPQKGLTTQTWWTDKGGQLCLQKTQKNESGGRVPYTPSSDSPCHLYGDRSRESPK
jgi:hypothetical protein